MKRVLPLFACLACEAPRQTPWSAGVEATTHETAYRFRTYGPSSTVTSGPDTVTATLGYYCSLGDSSYWDYPERELTMAWDGLFLQLAGDSTTLAGIWGTPQSSK